MDSTRLRRAFHYPDDSDHEPVPHDLDEQGLSIFPSSSSQYISLPPLTTPEQEQLIQRLQSQHETSNAKYTVA